MNGFEPHAEYLKDGDLLFVELQDAPVARSGDLDLWRNVDFASDGSLVAIEFVNAATMGVDLTDVPERETVERLIREADMTLDQWTAAVSR